MLDTITDLAREKSSDKRRELLGRVADMFFDGAEHHTHQESVIFRDIVMKMLGDVGLEGRSEFSHRVAAEEALPAEVARQLAQDDLSVAGPVLQHSPALTDLDFIEFSQSLPSSHLESIAQRERLSGAVTDALIENGTREVWHKVSQNQGAEITPKGFDTLVTNASGDQILQDNLTSRQDITLEAANKLLPLLPSEGKARLKKLFAEHPSKAGELVKIAQKQAVAEKLAGRKGRIETKLLINDVRDGKTTLSDALVYLVDGDRSPDIILLLSAVTEFDEAIVSNAFYQTSDEPIAILCKSLDVGTDAFTRLMSLRCNKMNQPLSVAGRSIARYKELDIASSQRAMRFVQMRKNLSQARQA